MSSANNSFLQSGPKFCTEQVSQGMEIEGQGNSSGLIGRVDTSAFEQLGFGPGSEQSNKNTFAYKGQLNTGGLKNTFTSQASEDYNIKVDKSSENHHPSGAHGGIPVSPSNAKISFPALGSDDDDDDWGFFGTQKNNIPVRRQNPKPTAKFNINKSRRRDEDSSDEDNSECNAWGQSRTGGHLGSYGHSSSSPLRTNIVQSESGPGATGVQKAMVNIAKRLGISSDDLEASGSISGVDSKIQLIIETYIQNSHGLKKTKIQVHSMFQIESARGRGPKPSKASDGYRMLLWYQASDSAIGQILKNGLRLRKHVRSLCFYDRLASCLDEKSIQKSDSEGGRKYLILCEVSLGNVYKSPHGHNVWKNRPLPLGYNSVKGNGEWQPDWRKNQDWSGVLVPCGETTRNTRFPKYEIDYNEYIVFNAEQVSIKCIVNVSFHLEPKNPSFFAFVFNGK